MALSVKEFNSQKISMKEKVGYSLGDAAANLVFQLTMIFQLKFYTDVFGLDGAIAGSVLLIASLSAVVVYCFLLNRMVTCSPASALPQTGMGLPR